MDLSKLFDQFNTQDSYAILFIILIAFLFGLLLGYILRSRRVMQLRRELKEKKKEINNLQAQIEAQEEQLGLKEADLKKAEFALREAEARAERIEEEKGALHREIFNLNRQIDELKTAKTAQEATIEELNTAIAGLQSRNEQLTETLETEDDGADGLAQMQSTYNATRQRLEAVEDRLELLAGENAHLREELEGLKNKALYAAAAPTVVPPREEPPAVPRSLHPEPGLPDASVVEEEPVVITNPDKPFLQDKIGAAAEVPEKDDLTLIDGIGPFLEKKLNEIGVFTYDEISSWDTARTREVTHAIQYFEGRIERDKWVEQAARLALKKHENPEAFKGRPDALSNDPEDLKVVEGIGPKIEELLKTAGINNWKALANADAGLLRDILEAAGPTYRIHDPSTWPAQARLAANGEWGVLKEYQAELHGGREPDRE
ncbi:MAG: DUF1049 domain-containing protein [Lewinellaceae bacterium]|nr:DUF1049 domain-containing protein [Lewinellaceae bacterium]